MRASPPFRLKILFWVILGAFSTYFAEVLSGSDLFSFFHPWWVLIVWPLYTLHALFLATVVFHCGRPRLPTLYAAATLFGMYEAYITKVLWDPFWGESWFSLGGIAVSELVVLVFFWHAFLSFIIPLLLGETMLTNSHEIWAHLPPAPAKLLGSGHRGRWLLAVGAGVLFGLIQSTGSPSIWQSLLSGVSTTALLLVLVWVWRTRTSGSRYSLRALLPDGRELAALARLLALMYVVLGLLLRPQAVPGLASQLPVWLLYAGLIVLLVLSLRRSRAEPPPADRLPTPEISCRRFAIFGLLLSVFSAIGTLLRVLSQVVAGSMWLVGGAFRLIVLVLTVKDVVHRPGDQVQLTR